MTVIDDYFCTLRLEPNGLIPLTPEEPDDFIHEISGKILCGHYDNTRDQIAGRFRVYYANFELGQNDNMSASDILDAYQHTFEYADAVLGSNGSLFSERPQDLLGDEIMVVPNSGCIYFRAIAFSDSGPSTFNKFSTATESIP